MKKIKPRIITPREISEYRVWIGRNPGPHDGFRLADDTLHALLNAYEENAALRAQLAAVAPRLEAADALNAALLQHNSEGAWCLVCGEMWDEANEPVQPHRPTCRIAEPRAAYTSTRPPATAEGEGK